MARKDTTFYTKGLSNLTGHSKLSCIAIDFALPNGTPIYATASGQVYSAVYGWNDGFVMKI